MKRILVALAALAGAAAVLADGESCIVSGTAEIAAPAGAEAAVSVEGGVFAVSSCTVAGGDFAGGWFDRRAPRPGLSVFIR